jgi:hypothetical protein
MYQNDIFLDENEKIMPDVIITVPNLETGKYISTISVSRFKNVVVPQFYIFSMMDTKLTLPCIYIELYLRCT